MLGVGAALLTDSQAAALLTAGRVQIRFHRTAPTVEPGWTAVSTSLISYDPKKDFFQADLKASTVGWLKPNTYRVEFRILATGSVPTPGVDSSFDLGSRSFDVTVTK